MSAEPLAVIWRCADVESPAYTGDEVGRWAPGVFTTLTGLGLLVEGKTASVVACDACAEGHAGEVMTVTYPDRQSRFFIRCGENGRVEVDRSRLLQWSVRFDPICRFMADELGVHATPEETVPARVWRIGRASLAGRSRTVWVARGLASDAAFASTLPTGRSTALFVIGRLPAPGLLKVDSGSIIELAEVVSLMDGVLFLDKAAVEAQLSASVQPAKGKPRRKRAERDANIGLLKKALRDHLCGARDHAHRLMEKGKPPELLPRPEQKKLAEQLHLSESTVSRALRDGYDRELLLLWRAAEDLRQVMDYRPR